MADALEQVKRQFGRQAVILNTRTATEGGLFGLGAKPYVEITAAPGADDLLEIRRRGIQRTRSVETRRADGAAKMNSPVQRVAKPDASAPLVSELGELKSLVRQLVTETKRDNLSGGSGALCEYYRNLVQNAVAEEIAQQLVDKVRTELTPRQLLDARQTRATLARAVESMLPTAGPIRLEDAPTPKIIALVGPTGVGKTTTIAKLAAQFCLRDHRKVGLITIDTYRIAAVEQLRTYADIIDVPLEVVMSPTELKDAVQRLSDRDVIFLDTAGRSQRDKAKNTELKAFFDEVTPHEVHLVLSSTCSEAVLMETVQRFRVLGIDRLIFTKLDEALGFGVMLACLRKAEVHLSYITTGQGVPEDIRVGEGKVLANLILASGRQDASKREGQNVASGA